MDLWICLNPLLPCPTLYAHAPLQSLLAMTIIAFCYSDSRSASVRYRVKAPLLWMRRHQGLRVQLVYPGYTLRRIWCALRAYIFGRFIAKPEDVILIHKVYSRGWYFGMLTNLLRHTRAHIIYDIDDAEWHRNAPESMLQLMQLSHCIHVGSTPLQAHLRSLGKPIAHLTSCLHPPHSLCEGTRSPLHIGWIGGYNSHADAPSFAHKFAILEHLLPALNDLPFAIDLTLIGPVLDEDIRELRDWASNCRDQVRLHLPRIADWENESEIDAHIAQWDLGIALMIDHPFNHAKSAFKAKQCMNCGVPVIGNRIGDNELFIHNHKTGYVVEDATAVRQAILHHSGLSQSQRQAMRAACIAQSRTFHMDVYVQKFSAAISASTRTAPPTETDDQAHNSMSHAMLGAAANPCIALHQRT